MHPNIASTPALERELGVQERVLWSGQPKRGLLLRKADIFLIPLSLLWAGFVVFWESIAIGSGMLLFMLWGIPFVIIGVYITIGRFFVDALQRDRTWYAVTNERILIIGSLFNHTVQSLPLRGLPVLTLEERADGSGTITFGTSLPFVSLYRGFAWPGMGQLMPPAFDRIAEARTVYALIRQAQQAP